MYRRRSQSTSSGSDYWRRVRCSGCKLRCSYRKFVVFPAGQAAFMQVWQDIKSGDDDPSKWKRKSKGTILGTMHQIKLAAWNHYTNSCPNWNSSKDVGQ